MKRLALLFTIVYVLWICNTSIIYAGGGICSVQPYDNIEDSSTEVWLKPENIARRISEAFGPGYTYTVEYAILPSTQWEIIPLGGGGQLCGADGNFSFFGYLKEKRDEFCGEELVFIITPYCNATQNGIPIVMSMKVICDPDREDDSFQARIEDLMLEAYSEGTERVTDTPCHPTDIPCIKDNIEAVINASPSLIAFSNKRAADVSTDLLNISAYPNPVQDYLHFNLPMETPLDVPMDLTITDSQGRVVHTASFEDVLPKNCTIDMSHLSTGMYFYQFKSNGYKHIGKVLKY